MFLERYMDIQIFLFDMIIFIAGCITGSFLNVCICRLPAGESLLTRSKCDFCMRKLKFLEMIPLVSCILLRGRCAYCGTKFGLRSFVVEFLTGALFVLVGNYFPYWAQMLMIDIFTAVLIVQAFIDYDYQILLDELSIFLLFTGIIYGYYFHKDLWQSLYGGLTGLCILGLIFILSRGGMGLGDVKLAFALGIWLGVDKILICLLTAFVFGGMTAILLLVSGLKERRDAVAFGPFLCIGAFIALVWGNTLWFWYSKIF